MCLNKISEPQDGVKYLKIKPFLSPSIMLNDLMFKWHNWRFVLKENISYFELFFPKCLYLGIELPSLFIRNRI